jgi:adenine-specific DNA-methyltransferase
MSKTLATMNINFDYPKPLNLIEYLIGLNDESDAIILDSFAGTGTTAHAVLAKNSKDGGNRKFILVELEEYAETLTKERVSKVVNGYKYTNKKKTFKIEGLGGGFKYCELGEEIFDESGELNPKLSFDDIAKHIYFVEFKQPRGRGESKEPFVGSYKQKHLYFYEKQFKTSQLKALVASHEKYKQLIVYTRRCSISADELKKHNVTVRYIPYDIKDN